MESGENPQEDSCNKPPEQTVREAIRNVRTSIDATGEEIVSRLKKETRRTLRVNRRQLRRFRKRAIQKTWGTAFEELELLMQISYEIGAEFNSKHRPAAFQECDYKFEVLTHSHGRGCRIAQEVLVLMRQGYASAALARWRTLHELTVVSHFIRTHDKELALRYLGHEVIESCKATNLYQKHHHQLGYEPLSEAEIHEAETARCRLLEQYGRDFSDEYGWASDALGKKNPRFVDIEEAVNMPHLRPYYKLSSHDVHAGPKGIRFNIGVPLDSPGEFVLAGPTNVGMSDPGQLTANSLYQLTAALSTSRSDLESLAVLNAMDTVRESTCQEFIKAHEELESRISSSQAPRIGGPKKLLFRWSRRS